MLKTTNVLKQAELYGQQFNVYGTPQEPLFKAQDLAQVLQLTNVSDMIGRVDVDEVTKLNLGSQSGETWFLTENGLYEVLMQSRKPIAKQFKKGVKTILKEIRCTGGYNSKPLSTLDLLELTIKGMRENQLELQEVKKDVLELKAQVTTRPDYYTVVGYGTLHGISVNIKMASSIGRKASNICKERGLDTDTIPDPRFGVVKTYPSKVLDEAFRMPLTPKTNN